MEICNVILCAIISPKRGGTALPMYLEAFVKETSCSFGKNLYVIYYKGGIVGEEPVFMRLIFGYEEELENDSQTADQTKD